MKYKVHAALNHGIKYLHICFTRLIGLSSQPDKFNATVLQEMAKINRRPIVFPLSNPKTQAECTFEAAMTHTDNQVLFASGTAFPPYKIPETGETKVPGQGNNGKFLSMMFHKPNLSLSVFCSLRFPWHWTRRHCIEIETCYKQHGSSCCKRVGKQFECTGTCTGRPISIAEANPWRECKRRRSCVQGRRAWKSAAESELGRAEHWPTNQGYAREDVGTRNGSKALVGFQYCITLVTFRSSYTIPLHLISSHVIQRLYA